MCLFDDPVELTEPNITRKSSWSQLALGVAALLPMVLDVTSLNRPLFLPHQACLLPFLLLRGFLLSNGHGRKGLTEILRHDPALEIVSLERDQI